MRTGFTLIELLAASLLASLLLVALAGVTDQAARRRAELRDADSAPWLAGVSRQLRWDLLHARKIAADESSLRLVGYAARSRGSGQALGRPTETTYELISVGAADWLVRREFLLDQSTLSTPASQLVCRDVARLEVRERPPQPQQPVREIGPNWRAIPAVVEIVLQTSQDTPLFRETFTLESP